MTGAIRSEIQNGICTITIENDGKRNAIDFPMIEEMIAEFEEIKSRDQYSVVVLRGAGEEAFSAGFDLDTDRSNQSEREERSWTRMTDTIADYPDPVIAMVNGDTYGGAVEILAVCDIRLGVEGARFGVTPAKIGLVYGGKAINRVMSLVGPAKTKEMLFTANTIHADHAGDIGLLNYVLNRGDLQERTYEMAENIATNAPFSVRAMKEITDTILEKNQLSQAELKWVQRIRTQAFESEDYTEGVQAFNEGRKPQFQNQ